MSYTDAIGTEKPGTIIELEGMAYQLHEPWTLESLKEAIRDEDTPTPPSSWRCRLGRHAWEEVASYEPLPPGLPPGLAAATLGLIRHLGPITLCERCGKTRRRFGI